jgi:hypothetical protein
VAEVVHTDDEIEHDQPLPVADTKAVAGDDQDNVTATVPLLGAVPAFRATTEYVPSPPDANGTPPSTTLVTKSTGLFLDIAFCILTELLAVFVSEALSTVA